VLYTALELRTFRGLNYAGEDVYAKYYEPKGLTQADYKADLAAGATLVVLAGDNGDIVYVPDTRILSYPNGNVAQYGSMIVSASLGPLRLDIDQVFIKSKVAEVLSDIIGLEPTVYIDVLANPSVLTQEQADSAEAARVAQIKDRSTTYAQLLDLQAKYAIAQDQIEQLQALLPP
jgi:hypothetical protein